MECWRQNRCGETAPTQLLRQIWAQSRSVLNTVRQLAHHVLSQARVRACSADLRAIETCPRCTRRASLDQPTRSTSWGLQHLQHPQTPVSFRLSILPSPALPVDSLVLVKLRSASVSHNR